MHIGTVYRINRSIARRRKLIWLAIIVVSILIRVSYYRDLNAGPLIEQHRWLASDMNYFDSWARQIAAGDLLSRHVEPAVHNWQAMLAEEYYDHHPAARPTTRPGETDDAAAQRRDVALWTDWIGPGKFYQEPLYPYLVAATYRFIGDNVRYVFAWQLLLGIGVNLLIYWMTRRVFGDLAGLIAAGLAVFYSPTLLFELILLRDSTVAFAGLLIAAMALRAMRRRTVMAWAFAGILVGVAVMLKSTFFAAVLLIGAGLAWRWIRRRDRRSLLSGLAFGAAVVIGLMPLIVRNVIVGVSPLATSGTAGMSFIITNAQDAGPALWGVRHIVEIQSRTHGALWPTVVQTLQTHESVTHFVRLLVGKFDATWRWFEPPGNENFYFFRLYSPTLRMLPITFFGVAPLGLVGMLRAGRRSIRYSPIWLAIAINLPALLLYFVQSRYRIALAVGVMPFAGWAVAWMITEWIARHRVRSIAALIAGGLIMCWTGRPLAADEQLVRFQDVLPVYEYYYAPKIQGLMAQHDANGALNAFDDAMLYQPDSIRNFSPGQPAISDGDRQMFNTYGQLYLQYAYVAHAAGDDDRARQAAALSRALTKASKD